MKIVRLQAENIKGLKHVDIKPTGSIVRITGKNAAGKTSAIDCIPYGLGGKRAIPSAPIRRGARHARIELDLGDMIVEQSITQKGAYLKVTGPDGKAVKSPQTVLDQKVGDLSFDPLAFSRMDGEKQAKVLRQLAGIDLEDLKERESVLMQDRYIATKEGKALAARLETAQKPQKGLPDAPIITQDLHNAIGESSRHNADVADAKAYGERAAAAYAKAQAEFEQAQANLVYTKAVLIKADDALCKTGGMVDIERLTADLASAYETNRAINEANSYREMASEVSAAREMVSTLTRAIQAIRDDRAHRMANAKYPLDGLYVSVEGDVIYGGVPLAQTSQAESTLISASIAMALNPELRLMLIRDGSLLDSDSEKALEELAEQSEDGYQIWIEQVAERDENGNAPAGFFIEDGELVSVDGAKVSTK